MSFGSDVKSAFAMGLRESWNDCLNDYSPRNWRDVRWSLIWLTTSAKCHCSHSRLYIYNLSSEALMRLPVKVLKTQQNRVLIISWRTIQYKLRILDWKRQHERFKHDLACLETKKNQNCMMSPAKDKLSKKKPGNSWKFHIFPRLAKVSGFHLEVAL